jgi:hypothetical protein
LPCAIAPEGIRDNTSNPVNTQAISFVRTVSCLGLDFHVGSEANYMPDKTPEPDNWSTASAPPWIDTFKLLGSLQ